MKCTGLTPEDIGVKAKSLATVSGAVTFKCSISTENTFQFCVAKATGMFNRILYNQVTHTQTHGTTTKTHAH